MQKDKMQEAVKSVLDLADRGLIEWREDIDNGLLQPEEMVDIYEQDLKTARPLLEAAPRVLWVLAKLAEWMIEYENSGMADEGKMPDAWYSSLRDIVAGAESAIDAASPKSAKAVKK